MHESPGAARPDRPCIRLGATKGEFVGSTHELVSVRRYGTGRWTLLIDVNANRRRRRAALAFAMVKRKLSGAAAVNAAKKADRGEAPNTAPAGGAASLPVAASTREARRRKEDKASKGAPTGELVAAKHAMNAALGGMLTFIKEPALAQEQSKTMLDTFLQAALKAYPQEDPRKAFIRMWKIPFGARIGRAGILKLLRDITGVPDKLHDALAKRYALHAKRPGKGGSRLARDSRNAARSFWLHVWLILSRRCVYSGVYPKTCQGKDFRNMTMPQLEQCGSGEHGKGKKKHRCSDLRRRIDVWTSSDAAELGAMYPCCKRCNEMANERGVTSELIALFMAYHRACQEVEKLERGVL